MGKEKHVTTTCYSGGNELPRCLRYNYFSGHIINIRVRRIEKMFNVEELKQKGKEACEKNDYGLYKKVCCELHLCMTTCPPSCEAETASALYDLLTNTKSEEFLAVAEYTVNKHETYGDVIVYYLLLSVRTQNAVEIAYLLSMCGTLQTEILNSL